jgi:hypothetical protein
VIKKAFSFSASKYKLNQEIGDPAVERRIMLSWIMKQWSARIWTG